jgi:hypothetical protein
MSGGYLDGEDTTFDKGNKTIKAKFTPGPWRYCGCGICELVWDVTGNICLHDGADSSDVETAKGEEEVANAQLIASAPEMYKALEKVIKEPQEAIEIMENNGLAIVDLSDKWQKLAFTFYTMLVNSATIAEIAIDKANGIE